MTLVPSQVRSLHQSVAAACGTCPACGARPEIIGHHLYDRAAYELVARCHGTTERLTLEGPLSMQSMEACAKTIWPWADRLFKLDAIADVRELLHYNRGTLPNG